MSTKIAVIACLGLSICACQAQSNSREAVTKAQPVRTAPAGQLQSYADVVSRVAPAVVTIRSERRVRAPEGFSFFSDPQSRDFFGGRDQPMQPRSRVERGLGSGVMVRADGHCLTNHHVVDGAEDISVELSDGRRLKAKLIGSDPASDLALLKIDATGLPVLSLGDSDAVRVGDIALAIGNPLGVGQTVTMGIISAKNRSTGLGQGSFEDFLQTDAPINQGNSGGALVNTAGELIGINSQIVSPSGGNIGIGFAIPSNMARSVMDQLEKNGKVRRGQLGVGIQTLTSELASSLGAPNTRGVLINSVTPGSPADKAGLHRGDIIIAFNGQPVTETNSLRNRVAGTAPGNEATASILRDGNKQDVRVKLGEFESRGANEPGNQEPGGASPSGKLGIGVEPATPQIASRLHLPAGQGLVIRQVDPDGAAAEAGLSEGDVLLEANRKPLRSVSDLESALRSTGPILLLANHGGQTFYLTIQPRAAR